jgi:hypothetical protein
MWLYNRFGLEEHPMKRTIACLLASLVFATAVSAQSLADVAKQAEEQRAAAKKDAVPPAAKTYSNKDLKDPGAPPTPGVAGSVAATPQTVDAAAAPVPAHTEEENRQAEYRATAKKDEAYWKAAMRALERQLEVDKTARTAAAGRLAEYTRARDRSFVMINGVPRVDRLLESKVLDATDELSRIDASVKSDRAAISDLEEDARRANVPPGWLRPGVGR